MFWNICCHFNRKGIGLIHAFLLKLNRKQKKFRVHTWKIWQQDANHGGFFWILNGHNIEDGEKWCYSIAFGLLALANAFKVEIVREWVAKSQLFFFGKSCSYMAQIRQNHSTYHKVASSRLHRCAFCQFSFWCIYYYGSNNSTRKETGKTHICEVYCS